MTAPERPAWSKRVHESISSAELAERAATWGPLTDDLRALVEATILSRVEAGVAAEVRQHIVAATELLRKDTDTGSHGVHHNDDGDVWHWGNAASGITNAIAPPLRLVEDPSGRATCETVLGAAYEGPPGCVHGGWIALVLDHISGRAAHVSVGGTTFTGTLTVKYLQTTRLGPITARAWVDSKGRNSFVVKSELATADGVCAEGSGVFVLAPWLRKPADS